MYTCTMDIPTLNLNLYKSFIAVYQSKNYSRAAEKLHTVPSAISYNIKELERQLGVKLFIAHTRGVDPTPEAHEMAKVLFPTFALFKNAESIVQDFHNLARGTVRISCTSIIGIRYLAKFATQFNSRYPNVKLHVIANNRVEGLRELNNHNVDIVVSYKAIIQADNDYQKILLKKSTNSFFASKEFLKMHKLPQIITKEKLSELPVLLLSKSFNFVQQLEYDLGVALNSQIEVSTQELLYQFILEGAGIGFGTDDHLDVQNDQIIKLNVQGYQPATTQIECIYNENVVNKAAEVFIQEMTEFFRSST